MIIKEYGKTPVNIVGQTDSTGMRDKNMVLSQQRAESVGSDLIIKGINGAYILAVLDLIIRLHTTIRKNGNHKIAW